MELSLFNDNDEVDETIFNLRIQGNKRLENAPHFFAARSLMPAQIGGHFPFIGVVCLFVETKRLEPSLGVSTNSRNRGAQDFLDLSSEPFCVQTLESPLEMERELRSQRVINPG